MCLRAPVQAQHAEVDFITCSVTGLEMPSSLPHPPKLNVPDPPFEYNTYVVHNVRISDDLKWSNPHTKSEGARPTLPCQLMSVSCLLSQYGVMRYHAVCMSARGSLTSFPP